MAVKTYRSDVRGDAKSWELLAEVERMLAAKQSVGTRQQPSPQVQHKAWGPLGPVLRLLRRKGRCTRVELELNLDAVRVVEIAVLADTAKATTAKVRSKISAPLRLAGRQWGELRMMDERDLAFGPREQVLLKRVAAQLARFLAGEGRYVLSRARMTTARRPEIKAAAGKGPAS